jgi:hypothetical protein
VGSGRIQEALTLSERDLDPQRGSVLVRNGKGGRRREIGMDAWGWEQLRPWIAARVELPIGPMFCIIDGPTRGRPWSSAAGYAVSPLGPEYGVGSRRTSYVMPMRSSSRVRECSSSETEIITETGAPTGALLPSP